jgi:hypothetical protein
MRLSIARCGIFYLVTTMFMLEMQKMRLSIARCGIFYLVSTKFILEV